MLNYDYSDLNLYRIKTLESNAYVHTHYVIRCMHERNKLHTQSTYIGVVKAGEDRA